MRKAFKITAYMVAALLIIIAALLVAVQTSAVQTFIARKVVSSMKESINADVSFTSVRLKPFSAIALKDVAVTDRTPFTCPELPEAQPLDTFFKAEYLTARFSLKELLSNSGIHIRRASVKNGIFVFTNEPDSSNLKRVLRFKSNNDKKSKGTVFDIAKVELRDFRFRFVNYKRKIRYKIEGEPAKEFGIDWNDMDVRDINIEGRNLKLRDGVMSGIADHLSFREKSGLNCHEIIGKAKVGNGKTIVEDLKFKDDYSTFTIPEYRMTYHNTKSFKEYISEVRMSGTISPSLADARTIAFFAPALKDNTLRARLRGRVNGYVNDLELKNLFFIEATSGISGKISGRLTGLPDAQGMFTDFQVEGLQFTTDGIGKFIRLWSSESKADLSRFAAGDRFYFTGKGNGPLNRLSIDGALSSNKSRIDAALDLRNLIDTTRDITIKGNITAANLNIGHIINNKIVKECSFHTSLGATLGKGGPSLKIDSLIVDKADILGYEYRDIAAAGSFSNNSFDGKIIADDPNLSFLFQGIFNLSRKTNNARYVFYANIGYADLNALNLDKRGTSKMSAEINADYTVVSKEDVIGNMDIKDLVLENDQGRHSLGDIYVGSHSNDNVHRIRLESSFIDGSFVGSKPFGSVFGVIKDITLKKELPKLFKNPVYEWKGDNFSMNFNLRDTKNLLSFVLPGLYVADNTQINCKITPDGILEGGLTSQRIAYKEQYIKDLSLNVSNQSGALSGNLCGSEIDLASFMFSNSCLNLRADDNLIDLGFYFDNKNTPRDEGKIALDCALSRNANDSLVWSTSLKESELTYKGERWRLKPSQFRLCGKNLKVEDFLASCGEQSLKVDGGWSSDNTDTLSVNLHQFDVSIANSLMKTDLGIRGLANGKAFVISPTKDEPGLLANLICDSASIAGRPAGTIRIASVWDKDDKKFDIALSERIGEQRAIDLKAGYSPSKKEISATAKLDKMDLGYVSPIFSSLFSEMSGSLSGEIKAEGDVNDIRISSSGTRFENSRMRLAFTNVAYDIDGPFSLTQDGITFDNIALKDSGSGTGIVSGGLSFSGFKDIRLGTKITFNNLECLNTTPRMNESFFGNVFASGDIAITGPLDAITLNINATTDKDGNFHIPLGAGSNATKSDLLTFYVPEKEVIIDPYDEMIKKSTTTSDKANDMIVKLSVNVTPSIEGVIELDKDASNVINARGSGMINLNIRPSRDIFAITGDYTIQNGNFHFNAMNIAKRDFLLKEGSKINFNGDIMESDLNVNGVYTTKTSLSSLIADTSSVSTRKTVNCGISVTDKLKNPRLKFSIDIDDLDPTTKSRVESALNTDDKVQRQLLSLLISNSFLPSEESGVTNNSSYMLYSNVADIMSDQLNNIFQKLGIPLDLGLNYESTTRGNDIFDVALSTQLFNNKIIVNGTIGNRQYNTSESSQDFVGDLDIEVKIDKQGRLRLNLFSHSADAYTNYLDNTQRNGIGIGYQQEFFTYSQFLKNMFSTKAEKEAAQQKSAGKKEDNVVLIIE